MVTEPLEVSTSRDRHEGYRQALEAAGVPFRPELVVVELDRDRSPQRLPGSARSCSTSRSRRPRSSRSTTSSRSASSRLRGTAVLEIPRDLALVCFDDIELVSRLYPFLTVMAQPAETFGTLAMQLLLDRIAGRGGERGRSVVLPADFIVRASCGAERAGASAPGPASPAERYDRARPRRPSRRSRCASSSSCSCPDPLRGGRRLRQRRRERAARLRRPRRRARRPPPDACDKDEPRARRAPAR